MSTISKNALLNILAAAQSNPSFLLQEDEQKVLQAIKEICDGDNDQIQLEDVSAYHGVNLWDEDSIRSCLESGMSQMTFQNMTEEEQASIEARISAEIDWCEVENAAWEAGREIINQVIGRILG